MGNRLLRIQLTMVVLAAFLTLPWLFISAKWHAPSLARIGDGGPYRPPTCSITGGVLELRFLLERDLPRQAEDLAVQVAITRPTRSTPEPQEPCQILSVPARREMAGNPYNVKVSAELDRELRGLDLTGALVAIVVLRSDEEWIRIQARIPDQGEVMTLVEPAPETTPMGAGTPR